MYFVKYSFDQNTVSPMQKRAIWRQGGGGGGGGEFLVHQVLRPPETKTCPFGLESTGWVKLTKPKLFRPSCQARSSRVGEREGGEVKSSRLFPLGTSCCTWPVCQTELETIPGLPQTCHTQHTAQSSIA